MTVTSPEVIRGFADPFPEPLPDPQYATLSIYKILVIQGTNMISLTKNGMP